MLGSPTAARQCFAALTANHLSLESEIVARRWVALVLFSTAEVLEKCKFLAETELGGSLGPVALLGDNHFRDPLLR